MINRILKYFLRTQFLIPLFFVVWYIAIPTRMHYSDGLDSAYFLERHDFGPEGLHPHHPLYLPIMRFLYELAHNAFPELRAIRFLSIISAFSGSICIWLFMRLLKTWGESELNAALAGFLMGSSFSFWRYSTDADAYIPSLAIALFGILLIHSAIDKQSIGRAILAGLIMAIGVLVHQLAIFIVISFLYFLFFFPRKEKRVLEISLYFILSFVCVTILFQCVNYLIFKSIFQAGIGLYLTYITSYAHDRYFWTILNEPITSVVYESARSHTHLFFHLKPPEVIFYDNLRGDTHLSLVIYKSFGGLSALIALFVLIIIQKSDTLRLHLFRALFIWLSLVFVFTTAFMPVNHFYKIFYLPPFILICAEFLRWISRYLRFTLKPIIAIVLVVYFVFNLTHGIIPDSKKDSNPFFHDTSRIEGFVGSKDIVIFPMENRYRVKFYRYFARGEALRVTKRIAYMDYWDDIYPQRHEFSNLTLDFFKSRFSNIYISEKAWNQGEEFLILSQYHLPGIKPFVLMIEKEKLVVEKKVKGFDGIYYKVKLS